MQRLMARLKQIFWIKFLMDVFARFGRDNGGLLAAGLAFFLVLAFVPLLLVGLWALGLVYSQHPDQAVHQIQGLLTSQILPGAAGNEVKHLMERAGIADAQGHAGHTLLSILHKRGVAGVIGVLGLIWAAMQVFINGATAMNAAWEAKETRSWVKLRLIALGLLAATGVLLVGSLAATAWSTHLSASRFGHLFPMQGTLFAFLFEVVATLVAALMYTLVFKFLPSAPVTWKSAAVGGLFAAVCWEVVKKGLAVYLLHPNTSLYGNLANLLVFIGWVYYSMMIFLLGAEASAVYAVEVEQAPAQRLKRAAGATPSADAAASTGTPLARAKERNRARRIQQTGRQDGHAARR